MITSVLLAFSSEIQMFRISEAFWLNMGVKDLSWAGPNAGFCGKPLIDYGRFLNA